MKKVVTYILLLAAGVSVFAQTTVESIREDYREIHEMIELMAPDSFFTASTHSSIVVGTCTPAASSIALL